MIPFLRPNKQNTRRTHFEMSQDIMFLNLCKCNDSYPKKKAAKFDCLSIIHSKFCIIIQLLCHFKETQWISPRWSQLWSWIDAALSKHLLTCCASSGHYLMSLEWRKKEIAGLLCSFRDFELSLRVIPDPVFFFISRIDSSCRKNVKGSSWLRRKFLVDRVHPSLFISMWIMCASPPPVCWFVFGFC